MSRAIKGEEHGVLGQHISWAGECPWTKALCFGSEDGKLLIPPAEIGRQDENITGLDVGGDAINGVAFVGDSVGITSRGGVRIGYRKDVTSFRLEAYPHSFKGGAHGIVGSSQNAFLAPIGVDGILVANLVARGEIHVSVARHREVALNFYRLVRIGESASGEVFACASRRDGLLAFWFANGAVAGPFVGHLYSGHDIVDVCPLNDPQFPFAAICLTRSRGIIFVRNVLARQEPVAVDVDELKGTAYSILSAQGHLFLLTDEEFVVLPNLTTRFLRNEDLTGEIETATTSTDASEIFLRNRESVLLIEDSLVVENEISELVNDLVSTDQTVSRARLLRLDPGWERSVELDVVSSPVA